MDDPANDRRSLEPAFADSALRPSVSVCIATFRRPAHLERTLSSIGTQRFERTPSPQLRIIVVENDPSRIGVPVVDRLRPSTPWPLEYEVESRRGISFARNTLVHLAGDSDFIVFIDDDEWASPHWLDELLATQASTSADAVLGPVIPSFEIDPPSWLAPFYARRRHETGHVVDASDFRTGNVLIRGDVLRRIDGPFDPDFALTGGSDGHLGRVLEARGARFRWADEAIVHETIPAARLSVTWILRRHFRTGNMLAAVRAKMHGRIRAFATSLLKSTGAIIYGVIRSLTMLYRGRRGLLEGMAFVAFGLGGLYGLSRGRYREYTVLNADLS